MDILFILSGALCATVAAVLGSATPKEAIYFIILIIFFSFLLAYLVLSVAKFYISRIEFLKNTQIVAWGEYQPQKRKFPFFVAIFAGLLLGGTLIIQQVEYPFALLLALALAFETLGWQLCALKRYDASIQNAFVLSHLGIFFNGKPIIFNGTTSGITNCKKEDATLKLTILKNKKEKEFSFEIPDDKLLRVDEFLVDMKEFFDEQE